MKMYEKSAMDRKLDKKYGEETKKDMMIDRKMLKKINKRK